MNKILGGLMAGLLVIGGLTALHADSVGDKIGVSGIAGASLPLGDGSVMDHSGDVGHDFGGMLRVGLSPKWSVGASYENINLYGKDERHHAETLHGNLLYHLTPDRKLVPTLQAGLGAGSTLTDGAIDKLSARAGFGVDYFFCPYLSAGPHISYTFIADSDDAADEYHILNAGFMVNLFFDKPKDSAPEAQTSTLAPMVAPPLASPQPVMENLVKQDVSIELKVLFDTGKHVVKPAYRSEIQQVADFMTTYPKTTAEIEGHSDNSGSAAFNKRLSQERANAVRDYLIKEFQIESSRLSAVGYGEEKPIADNKSRAGQEKNRRVVAILRAVKRVPAGH